MARLELTVATPGAQAAVAQLAQLSEAERKAVLEAARHGDAAGKVAEALRGKLSPAAIAAAQAMSQLTEAERRGAIEAGKLEMKLDQAAKKAEEMASKKSLVGQLGEAISTAGAGLVAMAAPASIFGAYIQQARADFEEMIQRAERAKNINLTYSQAFGQLLRNDPGLAGNQKLQQEFDVLFKEEGKKYEGLVTKLPAALADVRSSTSTLAISKDPEALKAAVSEAASLHAAFLGQTDIAADINSILQIADRDTRNIPSRQKILAASSTLATFQGASAGSADAAARILPGALPGLQFIGGRDQALALQAFASNQGLTQEAALGALQPMEASLRKVEQSSAKKIEELQEKRARATERLTSLTERQADIQDRQEALNDSRRANAQHLLDAQKDPKNQDAVARALAEKRSIDRRAQALERDKAELAADTRAARQDQTSINAAYEDAKRNQIKLEGANNFERLLSAAKLAKDGKLSIEDFAGGNQSTSRVFTALVNNPDVLVGIFNDIKKSGDSYESSASANRMAQNKLNKNYKHLVEEKESKASEEVSYLSDTSSTSASAKTAIVKSLLEEMGGKNVLHGGSIGSMLVSNVGRWVDEVTGISEDELAEEELSYIYQRMADGKSANQTPTLRSPFGHPSFRPADNKTLFAQANRNTLAGVGVDAKDGLDVFESLRLRWAGAREGQIAELKRVGDGTEEQIRMLAAVLEELKKQSIKIDQQTQTFAQPANL